MGPPLEVAVLNARSISHLNAYEMHIFQYEISSIPTATLEFLKKETAFFNKEPPGSSNVR